MSLIRLFKNEIIEFYCEEEYFGIIKEPIPAYKAMPDWFKRIQPAMQNGGRDHFGAHGMTAKQCQPLVDVMSLGFIIPLAGDVNIRTNADGSLIEAHDPPFAKLIEFHDKAQLGGKLSPTYPGPAIKFINHWVIKTAPGYSTLFVPPINRIEPRFTCLGGLVDTDKYCKQVNFPAIWHAKSHDDLLEAGTPLITCIPIRRKDQRRSAPVRKMTSKEAEYIEHIRKKQDCYRSVYRDELREPRK